MSAKTTDLPVAPDLAVTDILYAVRQGVSVQVPISVFDVAVGAEANTASNVGTGVGLFKQKTVEDLEFKTVLPSDGVAVVSATNELTVGLNVNGLTERSIDKAVDFLVFYDDNESEHSKIKIDDLVTTDSTLIYDSGATQGGNVFSSISDMLTELAGREVASVIWRTGATIPDGAYDFSNCVLWTSDSLVAVDMPDGVTLTGLPQKVHRIDITLESLAAGNGTKFTSTGLDIVQLELATFESTGDTVAISVGGGGFFILSISEKSELKEGSADLIENASGTCIIWGFDISEIEQNTLNGTAAITVEHSADCDISATQAGTVNITERGGGLGPVAPVTKVAGGPISTTEETVLADTSGGSYTLTLPALASVSAGKVYHIKKIAGGFGNPVTVDGNGAETIDGAANVILYGDNSAGLTGDEVLTVIAEASEWRILKNHFELPQGSTQGEVLFWSQIGGFWLQIPNTWNIQGGTLTSAGVMTLGGQIKFTSANADLDLGLLGGVNSTFKLRDSTSTVSITLTGGTAGNALLKINSTELREGGSPGLFKINGAYVAPGADTELMVRKYLTDILSGAVDATAAGLLQSFADDTAAGVGGIVSGGLYHNTTSDLVSVKT